MIHTIPRARRNVVSVSPIARFLRGPVKRDGVCRCVHQLVADGRTFEPGTMYLFQRRGRGANAIPFFRVFNSDETYYALLEHDSFHAFFAVLPDDDEEDEDQEPLAAVAPPRAITLDDYVTHLTCLAGQKHREYIRARDSGLEPAPATFDLLVQWKSACHALQMAQDYASSQRG